jgi:hypothetical protein
MLMPQLPLLLPFALPQPATAAAVGLDPVVSNQRRQRFRDALDVLVQAELELEHVEVTVLVVGAILIGLQQSLGQALLAIDELAIGLEYLVKNGTDLLC